jgi:uncharacterized RDD family membrane protein YckC
VAAASLSLDLSIETPENVVLTHTLAGPAWRGVAYLLDWGVRFLIFFAVAIFTCTIGIATLPGFAIGTMLLVLFLLEWGYFIGFEYAFQGRTPGKMLCGLRTIHENGQPLSWWGATLRNLLRAADTLPMMVIFGMTLTPKLQRLGDLAARTVVVHERRPMLPRDPVIYQHIEKLPSDQINSFPPPASTLAVIDEFLGRRKVLTHNRGHQLGRELAMRLAERLDYRGDRQQVDDFPMAFLARVYVTFAAARDDDAEQPSRQRRKSRRPAGAVS